MKIGDTVKCLDGCIDTKKHKGEIGQITGFAQFSSYHPREAAVTFGNDRGGWFWVRDLEVVEPERDEYGRTAQDRYTDEHGDHRDMYDLNY